MRPRVKPFFLYAPGLWDAFLSRLVPRVLWIGLDDPSQALGRLNERLMAALTPLGFPPEERPFHPHLTLARAQNGAPSSQLWPMLQKYHNRDFGEFLVTQLHLVQSQLQRGGAHTYYFTLCDIAELRWFLYPSQRIIVLL